MRVFRGLIEPSDFILWFIRYYLPAMVANATPVLIRGDHPIDGGARFIDGKPVFGAHKTWEGFVVGVLGAYISGSVLAVVLLDRQYPVLSVGCGFFALLGDMIGAFIKRRIGLKPGEPLIPLDQLDFALASTAYYYLLGVREFTENSLYVVASLVLIFMLHIVTNYVAYLMGLKHSKL